MKLVIIGGAGLIGSKVVNLLRQGGHDVVAASPNSGVNALTGEGLPEVCREANVVVDLSNSPSLIRRRLDARHDPRAVVADPQARYFGALLSERSLVPEGRARLGDIRFDDWLSHAAP